VLHKRPVPAQVLVFSIIPVTIFFVRRPY